ncbi:MAG: hypothetical protein WCC64_17300 [Aliidongia sp.]
MGVNTGHAGHNIQADPTFDPTGVAITIKGPVLNETFTHSSGESWRWSQPAIDAACERIDAAILAHPHVYGSIRLRCGVCKEGHATAIAMDADDLKALALLNDGFDRGQLVCDSFKATQSEQDGFARAMIRLERIVLAARGEAKR